MSVVISRLVWVGVVVAGVLFIRRLMPEKPVELPDSDSDPAPAEVHITPNIPAH